MAARVLGLDWARPYWAGIELIDGTFSGGHLIGDLRAFLQERTDLEVVAVDVPIGLPTSGSGRRCDHAAREFVGPRSRSVFLTPPKPVLDLESYEEANRLAKRRFRTGISTQAYGLRQCIYEVAGIVERDRRVIEVHPEVSFCELAGGPIESPKTSWDGQERRRTLISRKAGIKLPKSLGEAGSAPVADLFDACAAAWTAERYRLGQAIPLPVDAKPGGREVIWR